jgi:hypothetical protein
LRRLVVASVFLILVGLVILLPSSPLVSLLTNGSTSTTVTSGFSARGATTTTDTTTIESLVGFGLLGMGLVLEILSLFTDVGAGAGRIGAAQTKPAGEKQQ